MYENNSAQRYTSTESIRLLTLRDVAELTSLGMSTILAWEQKGRFPRALRLSPGKRLWRAIDVSAWLHDLVATENEHASLPAVFDSDNSITPGADL